MYNMGPINIKEMFIFRNNEYDLRGFNNINLPVTVNLCLGHIFTSPQDYGAIYLLTFKCHLTLIGGKGLKNS